MSLSLHLGPPTGPRWSAVCVGCAKIPQLLLLHERWTRGQQHCSPRPRGVSDTREHQPEAENSSGGHLKQRNHQQRSSKMQGKKVAIDRPTEREPAHRPKSERRQGTASSDPGRARVAGRRASPPPRSGLGMTLTVLQGLTWGCKHIPASGQVCKMRKYSFREERGSTVWWLCAEPRRWQALHLVAAGETAELLFYTGGASTRGRNPPHLGFGF